MVLRGVTTQFTAQFEEKLLVPSAKSLILMVGRARFELATNGLKV